MKFKKKNKKQAGVALMMVLSSIAMLTTLVVEFAYNSHVTSTMASNNLNRLQAHYLARSAMSFAKLQVQIEKDIRKQLKNYAKYLSGVIGSEPVCKILPFSTGLLRGGLGDIEGEADTDQVKDELEASPEGTEDSAGEGEELEFEGILQAAAAGDFLSFDGDFSVNCDVEDKKINLNYFSQLNPESEVNEDTQVNAYESHKRLVESLLAGTDYEPYFEDDPSLRRTLVNNISDWVDTNNLVDESPGFQGGYEDQKYSDLSYSVKNGKYSTVRELLMVSGMTDDIYKLLAPNVTIYGDDKINICLAEDPMIKAFVVRYSNTTPDVDPIAPDNDELLDEIIAAVRQVCLTPVPKANEVANAIREKMGLEAESATVGSNPGKGKGKTTGKKTTAKTNPNDGSQQGNIAGAQAPKALTQQISVESRYYSFDLTGSAGDIILNIKAVLNTEDADPTKWPLLYYRVE